MNPPTNRRLPVAVLAKDSNNVLFRASYHHAAKMVNDYRQAEWVSDHPPIIRARIVGLTAQNMTRPLKTRLYGNCHVLNPEGEVMFHCNQDKINWYLSRGLAEKVKDDPPTIQLKFQPNGPGHMGDDYYLTSKRNECVVCGSKVQLTRHHVVPWCYRKYFPAIVKDHSYHDILLLCVACHDKYEEEANRLKEKLAFEYGIPLMGTGWHHDKTIIKLKKHAHALRKHWKGIPPARREELLDTLRDFYKKHDITEEDMERAYAMESMIQTEDFARHGETIVAKISETYLDLESFVKMWRGHFLETMDPQFLPEHWNQDRPIVRERDKNDGRWA